MRAKAGIALSRVYRESGDLGRAIDTGERILADLAGSGLDSCDEAVQLAVTIAAAYFERGDSGHAVRICRAAIAKAEALGSPRHAPRRTGTPAPCRPAAGTSSAQPARRAGPGPARGGPGQPEPGPAARRAGRLQLALDPPAWSRHDRTSSRLPPSSTGAAPRRSDRAWTELGLARAAPRRGPRGSRS